LLRGPPLLAITIKGALVEAFSIFSNKRNVGSFDINPWFIARARVLVRLDLRLYLSDAVRKIYTPIQLDSHILCGLKRLNMSWPPNRIPHTEILPVHRGPGVILDTLGEDNPRVRLAVLKRLQDGWGVVRCCATMSNGAYFCCKGRARGKEEDQ